MLYTNRLLTSGFIQLFAILMLAGATHLEINAMNPGAHGSLMRTDDDVRITGAVGDFDQNPRLLSGHTLIKQEGFSDENRAANANAMRSIADALLPPTDHKALDNYLAAQCAYFNEGSAAMTMPEPTTVTTEHLQAQGLALPPTLESGRPSKRARIIVRANFTDQKNQQSHLSSSSSSSSSTPAPTTSPLTPPPCDLPQTPTAPSSTHAAAARFAAAAKRQREEKDKEEAQKKAANIDSGDDDAMTTKAVSEHAKESDGNEPDGRSTDLKRKARPHKCEHPGCGKGFTSKSNLQRHMKTHTGVKPHICRDCGQCFARTDYLTAHMKTHTGEKPYPCTHEGCGRSFADNNTLQRHMKTHTGVKPHICRDCGQCFARTDYLTEHIRTHTGEKPYQCTYAGCGRSFADRSSRSRHARTHTG